MVRSDGSPIGNSYTGRVVLQGLSWFLEYQYGSQGSSHLLFYTGSGFIDSSGGYSVAINGSGDGPVPTTGAGWRPQILNASIRGEMALYPESGTPHTCGDPTRDEEVGRFGLTPR